ncbi:MAG TPA: acetyl-CoA carboxylase carboxyl transferase subunit alpha, partial [Bacteroides sp.]|nr:acetyl-CoA carboxylase carboxyl transferase subunit alpha [Bacteroides sp.]
MLLKGVFKKTNYIPIDGADRDGKDMPNIPDGLFTQCPECAGSVFTDELENNMMVCPKCGHHMRMKASDRIAMIADEGSFEEWDKNMPVSDPLQYEGYPDKISSVRKSTGLDEAVVTGRCLISGHECVICVCDSHFLMGSMGENVGEKITRAAEKATRLRLPIIIFTCSGGARMQEGIVSLMQMAKTSAALKQHDEAGLLYITVLTDPTTGGVTASFAMLGDIILAEPGALVGFAGPRVIRQTIRQELPEGFQRAEFLLEHGLIDNIVRRKDMKETLAHILAMHDMPDDTHMPEYKEYLKNIYTKNTKNTMNAENSDNELPLKSAWTRVQTARDKKRPTALDYIENVTKGFYELHGDR